MVRYLLNDFIHLLFPTSCLACEESLVYTEKVLCTYCLGSLPNVWENHTMQELVGKNFWGQLPIEKSIALFSFTKTGVIQKLLHKAKYNNRTEALKQLGKYGGLLWRSMYQNQAPLLNAIVPVPLHPKRLQERGYNQSYLFSQGIASTLDIPCKKNWLRRVRNTDSQTKKHRKERLNNVSDAFSCIYIDEVANSHILLVDDLITTGATLQECAKVLLNAGAAYISIAVLAVAT